MKTIIIGGGVIGLCCAYYLQQEGVEVIVLDKSDMQDGCSYGNAGMVVPSHIIPLAAPGMIAQGVRWMFNAESPFFIKPRLDWDLLYWGWRFYQSANEEHVLQSIPVLRDISLLSKQLFRELSTQKEFDFSYTETGLLMLYKTAQMEEEEAHTALLANKEGIIAKQLSAGQVKAMEPDIELDVRGGVYYPGDAHLDPGRFLSDLKKYLHGNGVKIYSGEKVLGLQSHGQVIQKVATTKKSYEADEIVLACGSWSAGLARSIQLKLPLQAGKGYSITLDSPLKSPRYPSILTEAKVAVTPIPGKLRFAGTMEIGGLNLKVNQRRVNGILKSIPQYLPDFQIHMPSIEKIWRGLRPCSPDGLPYIGRSKKYRNLTIASGHAMMGLSLAPATGKLVSEILTGRKLSMGIGKLDPNRFAGIANRH